MNTKNSDLIFTQYRLCFDSAAAGEISGTDSLRKGLSDFKKKWNPDDADFPAMLRASTSGIRVFLDTPMHRSLEGITALADIPEETAFVREQLIRLFHTEDHGDLDQRASRILDFRNDINVRIGRRFEGKTEFEQTAVSVLNLLSTFSPSDNYFYKKEAADLFAQATEFGDYFMYGNHFSLKGYYKMCDNLLEEVWNYPEILKLHQNRMVDFPAEFSNNLHFLAYDILDCAYRNDFYSHLRIRSSFTDEWMERAKRARELAGRIDEIRRELSVKKAHLKDLLSLQLPAVDGISVAHRVFGSGTVSSCVNGRMTIRFSDTEKAFLYPKAFLSGFLKPDDSSILEQLRRITQAEEARPMLELEISDLEEQLTDAQKALEE